MSKTPSSRIALPEQLPAMTPNETNTAVLMLCCRDYEAVELALACHVTYGDPSVPLFALQNCRGDYDAERTRAAIRRYASLYPQTVRVIDDLPPDVPYNGVRGALASDALKDFQFICKVDDDAFPIAKGWLSGLCSAWAQGYREHGDDLAYVTPLLNNNNWGFPETLRALGLEDEFFARFASRHPTIAHAVATGSYGPIIWNAPHIARWLHERSTFVPDRFIEATRGLAANLVDNMQRYSIGCILFRRDLWDAMDDGGTDDELMLFVHCRAQKRPIVCARSVPFVHLSYYPQKDELRDVVRQARDIYAKRLSLTHPIGLRATPTDEIEARLRFVEQKVAAISQGERPAAAPAAVTPAARTPAHKQEHDPDRRFLGRPNDELILEEQAARESNAWIDARMPRARRVQRPVETLKEALSLAPRGGLALEFGVGSGSTLRVIADARCDGRVWGFDSFQGLPEAWRPGFPVGAFKADPPAVPGAALVVGLFDKTLPQFLVEQTDPIDFVHIDCDLYSSTRTVLNLIRHRLRPGTVLSFDEYFNYPGWQQHEHKAWIEFAERTGLKFSYEVFTLGDEQVAVRIQ
jgi:hypothetical protein